ncbi:MAG: sigma-70 family RNA polymerase sigma factor [Eubacterium sp.]|nr:sigma-70 family RNA polymerase sigma factor [Lachnospiraceae bacterium]MBO5487836.1 sigma-70 family RNA polymerase sigma factor [Eubacterium sp.]
MNRKKQSLNSIFIETVDVNKTAMFRLAYSIVLNKEDAEDVVSESILKAYSHLYELRNTKKMKAWLFQILVNESKTCLRKRKRIELVDDFSKFENRVSESDNGTSSDLLEYIYQLEDIYKEIIILYYFEQFHIREIAKILNLSEGTVKSRLFRARAELKKFLEENHWKG